MNSAFPKLGMMTKSLNYQNFQNQIIRITCTLELKFKAVQRYNEEEKNLNFFVSEMNCNRE